MGGRNSLRGRRGLLAGTVAAALLTMLLCAAPASADLNQLLGACSAPIAPKDAADGNTGNGVQLPYTLCDDGLPPTGGTTPNNGAAGAVAVPQKYAGITGLPAKVSADAGTGADANGDIALDVDLSLPDPTANPMPAGGYPLVVMMHGCCAGDKTGWEATTIDAGGERWHYNNAWFASRGYAVLTYTARGFVNGNNQGSTGQTQLDSARYEINDYQYLAGLLADRPDLDSSHAGNQTIDPQKVVPTGGSYGGGFTWLALTDPAWNSPGAKAMRVVAAAPKYGWTNLIESLIPNGADRRDSLTTTDPAQAVAQHGFPKQSINAALYASGKTGIPSQQNPMPSHTTFPPKVDQANACLGSSDPFENNPVCTQAEPGSVAPFPTLLNEFIAERSAYYQNSFFDGLADHSILPVPVFSAGTFTDQLFPSAEHRRMVERLKSIDPTYPVQEYYGDYNHFVQNKPKEWADLCGADDHRCTFADYGSTESGLNSDPATLKREVGVTTRLNRFIDHYAQPPGNPSQPMPAFDVTGSLQICPDNATGSGIPADEPGQRFTAPTFAELAPNSLKVSAQNIFAITTNHASPNNHAANSDPVGNSVGNGGKCPTENTLAGAGVSTVDSDALSSDFTMLGETRVTVHHTHSGADTGLQLNARLYDLFPDGHQVMVARGTYVVPQAEADGTSVFDLHGAGWRFPNGHKIRIEIAQDDSPYIKASSQPSGFSIDSVSLDLPVREGSASTGGGVPPGGDGTGSGGAGGSSGAGSSAGFSGSSGPLGKCGARSVSLPLKLDLSRTKGRLKVGFRLDQRAQVIATVTPLEKKKSSAAPKTIARRQLTMKAGRRNLLLKLPRHAKKGSYRVTIKTLCGGSYSFRRYKVKVVP